MEEEIKTNNNLNFNISSQVIVSDEENSFDIHSLTKKCIFKI